LLPLYVLSSVPLRQHLAVADPPRCRAVVAAGLQGYLRCMHAGGGRGCGIAHQRGHQSASAPWYAHPATNPATHLAAAISCYRNCPSSWTPRMPPGDRPAVIMIANVRL